MYAWRNMNDLQRGETLRLRQQLKLPQHGPAHRRSFGPGQWMLTGACYEHQPWIGVSVERMGEFEDDLVNTLRSCCDSVMAWVVLPNHYHALVQTADIRTVLSSIGRVHGRTAHKWNGEDDKRGRQVWFRCAETLMKSEAHFWATTNYVHHNPVKHGYVNKWTEWPYSSAAEYLSEVGEGEAAKIWKRYPVAEYGRGWDD
jgi:putative transposase